MGALAKSIIILSILQTSVDSNILDEENVKLSLQYLCPGVVICSRNELDPRFKPKEIDGQGYGSCCHGCSCHTDCYINNNCCYFDNKTTTRLNMSTHLVNMNMPIEQGNSSLISDRNRLLKHEGNASIETNETTHATTNGVVDIIRENETVNRENMTVDNANIYIDIDRAIKQCMYIKTGSADESWRGLEPAVRIVTSPPSGGCKPNTVCPTLTQQSEQATCNSEDIFPWGDLFPVYSAEYELIFKNELCACCYGILEYTPLLQIVTCDNTNRNIPISEHFSFLQPSRKLSSYCSVTFRSVDTRVIIENQCFVDTIGTCPFTGTYFPPVPDGVNLTRSEIVKACSSGPDAPVALTLGVFKNVFCAMCNQHVLFEHLQCFAEGEIKADKGFGASGLTYLLDATTVKELTKVSRAERVFSTPIACLRNQGVWNEESCRTISCPSGQTRMDGVCIFPSNRWMLQGGFGVIVNLRYIPSNTSVLRMVQTGEVMREKLEDAFKKTSPWPTAWTITKILHTSKDYNFSPQLAVYLRTEISLPKKLMFYIETSMRRQWNIVLGGMGISFQQSFMKYELFGWDDIKPDWFGYVDEFDSFVNVSVYDSMDYENLLPWSSSPSIPFLLNKLVICEQISLSEDEYTIMAGGLVLLNKLTNETLFSLEFESVDDGGGELVPRICLTDSPFVLRRENNGASTVSYILLNHSWIFYILGWMLKLKYA